MMRFLFALFVALLPSFASAQIDVAARDGRRDLAFNLAGVAAWSTQLPFIDAMRMATNWIGHLPGQWGGVDEAELFESGILDEFGWPNQVPRHVRRLSTSILVDLPAEMTSTTGRWHVRWEGSAYLGFNGAAQNVRYGRNSATFDFEPGNGSVFIEFSRGSVRNLTVVHERHLNQFVGGAIFNPDWLRLVEDAEQFRFMDWMQTNNSTISSFDQRPLVTDYSFMRRGVPLEVMVRLANETGAEAWFNFPHLADDDYVRQTAQLIHDSLNPDLRAWYEFSNEVWNWGFLQAGWAEEYARARWDREWGWVQFAAVRAAEVMRIVDEVYVDAPERRVRVLGLFTGWLGLEHDMFEAPDYLAEDPAHVAPHHFFDAIAVTGYFSGELHSEAKSDLLHQWLTDSLHDAEARAVEQGLSGAERDVFITAHQFDLAIDLASRDLLDGSVSGNPENSIRDLIDRTLTHHAANARAYDLALVMYEGGTHIVARPEDHGDQALVEFFIALNFSPQMGDLYRALIAGWRTLTPAPFNDFGDVGLPSVWGSWGSLRHLDDQNPRWDAIMAATAP